MSDGESSAPRRGDAKRAQDRRRRERVRDKGGAGRYTVEEIGERDGWVCGLCRDAVDGNGTYRHPDPRSPSVDHVRAIAAGGADTVDNVRLTHWGCNHERNDGTPLGTVEEAESRRAALLRVPALRDYAESLTPEDMIRRSQALHSPERYRAKLARRVERYEREERRPRPT
ncbi:HNH endonuclease signature motif containing protein [Streptomyces sp. NPDC026672]|uniref:HNH endonuclease n=1 Tax=unclassified Streptomyces TaxID=2593676 RepID=UPI0034077F82